jgi:SanA protein
LKKKLFLAFAVLAVFCIAFLLASRIVIARAAKNKTYSKVSEIPYRPVGLVLGCPKQVFGGYPNPFFENRIAAAAELVHKAKVDYLIVSGDNHT